MLLLVGGMGTRLRSVLSGKPKPLAPIGEISFLELLVMQLRANGFRNLVMCTGFEAGQIHEKFGDGHKWNVNISYSEENQPLGTAGAIKLAEPFLRQSPNFVVMNGDSFLELDLRRDDAISQSALWSGDDCSSPGPRRCEIWHRACRCGRQDHSFQREVGICDARTD